MKIPRLDLDALGRLSRDDARTQAKIRHVHISRATPQAFVSRLAPVRPSTMLHNIGPRDRIEARGYREELLVFYERCATAKERDKLLGLLGRLAFTPPHDDWPRISKAHRRLVDHFGPLACAAIARSDTDRITDNLLQVLRAYGRIQSDAPNGKADEAARMVAARPKLNQALFWADLAAAQAGAEVPKTQYDIAYSNERLWVITQADRRWLEKGLRSQAPTERLICLDTLFRLDVSDINVLDRLAKMITGDLALSDHLSMLRREHEATVTHQRRHMRPQTPVVLAADEAYAAEMDDLHARATANPAALSDPARLAAWPGPAILHDLILWLCERSKNSSYDTLPQEWAALVPAFGESVAEHFRRGMKVLWRVTPPEAPRTRKGKRLTLKSIQMSTGGMALEAAEDCNWARKLSPDEARRAARHVFLDDQGVPQWIGDLAEAHGAIVAPLAAGALKREWASPNAYAPLLNRLLDSAPLRACLGADVLSAVRARMPAAPQNYIMVAHLLGRLAIDNPARGNLLHLSRRRYNKALKAGERDHALGQLRLILNLDPLVGGAMMIDLLTPDGTPDDIAYAEEMLHAFFNFHRGSVIAPERFGASLLAALTSRAYVQLDRHPLRRPEDAHRPEDPRDALLSALVHMTGEEAFIAVRKLAAEKALARLSHRLLEISHEIAERDAERPSWNAQQIRGFETAKLAPISTGDDLFALVCDLLDHIQWQFGHDDMSARSVVATAVNEDAVQQWLGATLEMMGGGRFISNRETRVAGENKPDLILTCTTAPFELGIEIKHDEKGWTMPDLRQALQIQLVEHYLQPADRRHGILVISNHRDSKFWRDATLGRQIGFTEAIAFLSGLAQEITSNNSGLVRVAVRGTDASPRIPKSAKDKPASGKQAGGRWVVKDQVGDKKAGGRRAGGKDGKPPVGRGSKR